MLSKFMARAIEDAQQYGRALLKFISPNDVGLTGSHQCGFYLPRPIWRHYTNNSPTKGINSEESVEITWPDGLVTHSCIKWYGKGTRSEYRLTRFGRDFPWLNHDNVGCLLILIPTENSRFLAYVADTEDDIDNVLSALALPGFDQNWLLYERDKGVDSSVISDMCVTKKFEEFLSYIDDKFPAPIAFSLATNKTLRECFADFSSKQSDHKLLQLLDYEYKLFKLAERRIYSPVLSTLFKSVDHFLETASSIMNRRKNRAGASLENHVETILKEANIPFTRNPWVAKTRPDFLIPSVEAYNDPSYPDNKLFALALKTTCRDRWRQVTREAPRIKVKHLLTIQQGISANQLQEIKMANIELVVPEPLQICYPKDSQSSILSVENLVAKMREAMKN